MGRRGGGGQAKREEAIGKVDKLMAEWEELEQLLAS